MPPRGRQPAAAAGAGGADDDALRMPALRRDPSSSSAESEGEKSDDEPESIPSLADASSSAESSSDDDAAPAPKPSKKAAPAPKAKAAPPPVAAPAPPPAPVVPVLAKVRPGCRHGFRKLEDCETCSAIINGKGAPKELKWDAKKEEYVSQHRRGRYIFAEMDLAVKKDSLGSGSASLAAVTKYAREAVVYLHKRSEADPDMKTILERAKDQTKTKKEDAGVVMICLIFAAHYGELEMLLTILRKTPTGLLPALLNANTAQYPGLAQMPRVKLESQGKVQDNNQTYWPMTTDQFIEDSPLVAASRRDNTEHMLILLSVGADPDATAACGATALGVAAVSGFVESCNVLLCLNVCAVAGTSKDLSKDERTHGSIKGDIYRVCHTRQMTAEAEKFMEVTPGLQGIEDPRLKAYKMTELHEDRTLCPAVWAPRWCADVNLPSSVEMKHIGLALSRSVDRPFQGQRVEGTPLELAVRGGTMAVVDVLLRAGAKTDLAKMGAKSLYDHIFDRTSVQQARRDSEIENLSNSKDADLTYLDFCLGSCLSPDVAARLRSLSKNNPDRGKIFEKERRETQLWRLGVLLHQGGVKTVDFRGRPNKDAIPLDAEKQRRQRDACERLVILAKITIFEYKAARIQHQIEPSREETESGRENSQVMKKAKSLNGDQMCELGLFLGYCRLAKIIRTKTANYVCKDALLSTAQHLEEICAAATEKKTAYMFPAPKEPSDPDFDAAFAAWCTDITACVADLRARAAASTAPYDHAEAPDWIELADLDKKTKKMVEDARVVVKQLYGRRDLDPDGESYLAYLAGAPCYGPEAARPFAGFDGEDANLIEEDAKKAAAAPPPPAPAPVAKEEAPAPADDAPKPEDPAVAAKREEDRRKKAEADAKKEAEKQRLAAEKRRRDLERKEENEKKRAEERAIEAERKRKAEEKKKKEEAKRKEAQKRRNLWDTAGRKAGAAKKAQPADLVRALPWTDLAAHYGVQEAQDTAVDKAETPGTAAPGPLNVNMPPLAKDVHLHPVPEDEGRAMSGAETLIAERVLAWYGKRGDQWRKRCLDVLSKLASGADGQAVWARAGHVRYLKYGLRCAALDASMRLLWSATLVGGEVRVLAWCCVRAGAVEEACEQIKEALERRAGVKEDEEPYLTLGDDDVLIMPGKNRPMKLWKVDAATLARLAALRQPPARWSPKFRLTSREMGAVEERGAPAMVLGRSGTGKTHCIIARIRDDAVAHPSETLLFSTRSQKLRAKVERAVAEALLDEEGNDTAGGAKREYLTAAASDADPRVGLLPYLESKLHDLPAKKAYHARSAQRRRRFYREDQIEYRKDRDANGKGEASTDEEESQSSESDLSDAEADAARERRAEAKRSKEAAKTWAGKDYVTFAKFFKWWSDLDMKVKPECDFCWTQIQSFLKGSTKALFSGEPVPENNYLLESGEAAAISKRRALGLSRAQRELAYQVFKQYEKWLEEKGLWDAADREVALVQRVLRDGFKGGKAPFDRVYVDEVQDMTQASLAVLLLAVGGDAGRLYCCGDTAQAIQDGVAFRFSDLRETIYELGGELKSLSRNRKGAQELLRHRGSSAADEDRSKKLYKLTKNYRAHAGVLGAANAVLDLVHEAYPNAVDKTDADAGVALGPRPTFATDAAVLRDLPKGARLLFRADALRAAQTRVAHEDREWEKKTPELEEEARKTANSRGAAAEAAASADVVAREKQGEAEAHADEVIADRKAKLEAYDAKALENRVARQALVAKRGSWREEEHKKRREAKRGLDARNKREEDFDKKAEKRRKKAADRARSEAEARRKKDQDQAVQEALDAWMRQHAPAPPAASVRELLATLVTEAEADALADIFEAEDVDLDACTIMSDADFEDVGVPPGVGLAARLRDGAARALAGADAPPPQVARPPGSVFTKAKQSVPPLAEYLKRQAADLDLDAFKAQVRAEAGAVDDDFDEKRALLGAPTDADARLAVPSDDEDRVALGPRPGLAASRKARDDLVSEYLAQEKQKVYDAHGVTPAQVQEHKNLLKQRRKAKKKAAAGGAPAEKDEALLEQIKNKKREYRLAVRETRRVELEATPGAFECAAIIEDNEYGSRAFSVQEFKGLEDDAIVLVDFFGGASGDLERGWRDLLRAARSGKMGSVNVSSNRGLERDLKVLYTALTRCRSRLVVLETGYGEKRGAAQDAEKFFAKEPGEGKRPLAERQAPSASAKAGAAAAEDDQDEQVTATADEWRSRGALNARIAAEHADDPMAPPDAARDRLDQARKCFAKAEDQKLTKRCDAARACLDAIPQIRVHLEMASQDRAHVASAEALAAEVVAPAVEHLAVDDALRVLELFPRDEILGDVADKIAAVRDAAMKIAGASDV